MSVNFDRAVEYYDRTRGFPAGEERAAVQTFIDAGALTPESVILEIGIGTGRIALPLAPSVRAYYGVDISDGMIAKLRGKMRNEPIYPILGDATRLPFPNGAFDAVTAVHIFHLIPKWQTALAECARVLKPGGRLLHGWGAQAGIPDLEAAWNGAARGEFIAGGEIMPWDKRQAFIMEAGWTEIDTRAHDYIDRRTPREYLEGLRNRIWSNTWRMSDADLAAGIAAVQTVMQANYPDPDAVIAQSQPFRVQAFTAP